MSKLYGAQSQRFDGIVQAIGASHPKVWKVISPDSDILRNIKNASPSTETIVRIYTGPATIDDAGQHSDPEQYGRDYATLVYSRVQDPQHMTWLESENEPNDHYGNLTEFIKRVNAFLVGFSSRAKELGFKPLGPNFSTGYPEVYVPNTDYTIWPNAWQGLSDGLRGLRDASGGLGLHEYDSPDLFRLWSDTKRLGYLVGRHKAVYASLPQDLQSLPLYLTEFGIDFLTQGVEGGFWHNRGDDAYQFMIDQTKEAYKRIYSTTPQLAGVAFFLWGATDPHFAEYDIKRTDPSIAAFTAFFDEEISANPMPFHFTHYPLPKVYPISQPFGANPAYYQQFGFPGHEGIDFLTPVGVPVRSVADGVATLVSQSGNYGNHIEVTHTDSNLTIYAHLSSFSVQQGESVKSGQQLGLSGASGNVTGPHLHLTWKWLGHTYTSPNGVVWPNNIFDPTQEIQNVQGDGMTTAQEKLTNAWRSTGVVYNPDAAYPKIAQKLGIGRPVGNEYNYTGAGGSRVRGQGFALAFLESPEEDVLSAKPYDWLTGLDYVPVAPPNPTPNPTKRLTTADLPPEYGIIVNSYAPAKGEKFFGLVGAGPFKSGPEVGTQTTLVAVNEQGSPVIGYSLTHAYDEANHKSETFPSPQVGVILGTGSYYNPPAHGGDHFYVSKGAAPSGTWPTKYPSDEVIAGMPGGEHFEASYTWELMTGT